MKLLTEVRPMSILYLYMDSLSLFTIAALVHDCSASENSVSKKST